MSQIDIQTEQDADSVNESIRYAAAVIANIRVRLEKYQECYVDDLDLLKIWGGKPWLSQGGNLHDRIKNLAKEIGTKVDWPRKGEAHFVRDVPCIIVSPGRC